MTQLVIIGAGPIGLYWARLLAGAGVNVLVLNPRAGRYTRPGGILIKPLNEFVRFSDQSAKRGIVVEDEQGTLESITCDYVFDCTGSKRVLLNVGFCSAICSKASSRTAECVAVSSYRPGRGD